MSARSQDVQYDCALLTDESLLEVDKLVHESGILQKASEMGIKVPDMTYQKDMHCTFRYMNGYDERRGYQLCNEGLHKQGTLKIEGIAIYVKDGVLRNVGLLVNDTESFNELGFEGVRDNLFSNEISHVTIAINPERDENGKRMAKAVDTQKCFTEFDGTETKGEFSYQIKLDSPITLTATAEAMTCDGKADRLIDYPLERLVRETVEEKDTAIEFSGKTIPEKEYASGK